MNRLHIAVKKCDHFLKFSSKDFAINYSSVPNRRACTFISGKVCLLSSIDVKRKTLPEINMHACLFLAML